MGLVPEAALVAVSFFGALLGAAAFFSVVLVAMVSLRPADRQIRDPTPREIHEGMGALGSNN
ncbi:methyl-accepting chemotaxis protein [Methylorubrum populi]|uniref:Methyl-accepting chemotaxis protein n=1 Tax=Methylorubrum populi TaxID=223967 RepID=A0A160PH56_9HYPH|nr:methyl-accepting chemotaxis protein [Methylorubrum populi]